MTTKNKVALAFLALVLASVGYAGVNKYILLSKFEPIKNSARAYLMENSTSSCWDADMIPFVITDNWASIRAIPDMKNCITDPCWIIMRRVGESWTGYTLGTCCFMDTPRELFKGEDEWWPEPIEEEKEKFRENKKETEGY